MPATPLHSSPILLALKHTGKPFWKGLPKNLGWHRVLPSGEDFNFFLWNFSFLIASFAIPLLRALESPEHLRKRKAVDQPEASTTICCWKKSVIRWIIKLQEQSLTEAQGGAAAVAGTEIVLAQAGISHSGSGVGAGSRCRASLFSQSIRQVPSIPSPG